MKTRFKSAIILSAATLWLAAGSAMAEPPGPPPDGGAARIERLAILLDLDAGQKVAVQKVFEEQFAERQALRKQAKDSGTRPTREEMHAKHAQMQQETLEKLRPILSDQQLVKFQALAEPSHGPGPGRFHDKKD